MNVRCLAQCLDMIILAAIISSNKNNKGLDVGCYLSVSVVCLLFFLTGMCRVVIKKASKSFFFLI